MPLNAAQIQGLQPNGASYKKADDRGLYLLIKPNGSKLWHFKYRFASKEKKMPLGQWPNVTLAKARLLRDSGLTPFDFTHCCHQYCVDPIPQTKIAPCVEIALHRRHRREVLRQHPPLTTARRNVEDRIRHPSQQ